MRQRQFPDLHLAIKTHPAETPDVYALAVAGRERVTRAARLGAAGAAASARASAIVTVNSTVALDAAVLGVPSLVIGLPNNLSPFVDAGVMAGVDGARTSGRRCSESCMMRSFAGCWNARRSAFLRRYRIESDGQAADAPPRPSCALPQPAA